MGLLTIWQCGRMRERENAAVFALVEQIRQQYPQVDEDTFMQTLNDVFGSSADTQGTDDTYDADTAQELRDLRERYGIREDDWAVAAQEPEERRAMMLNVVFLLLAEGLIVVLFTLYLHRRKQRLDQLTLYMERISMGQYDLDLLDNSEDELSNLKNQLYKIMIYLKEQADRERNSRKVLADSVSDISHQLKTPLTSAMIMLDNLTDNPDMEPATRRKFIAEAARQVDSMKWMIVSMLKLSRLDAGMIEFEEKEFSLDEMIASGAESLEVLAELKGQTVEIAGAKGRAADGRFPLEPGGLCQYFEKCHRAQPGGGEDCRKRGGERCVYGHRRDQSRRAHQPGDGAADFSALLQRDPLGGRQRGDRAASGKGHRGAAEGLSVRGFGGWKEHIYHKISQVTAKCHGNVIFHSYDGDRKGAEANASLRWKMKWEAGYGNLENRTSDKNIREGRQSGHCGQRCLLFCGTGRICGDCGQLRQREIHAAASAGRRGPSHFRQGVCAGGGRLSDEQRPAGDFPAAAGGADLPVLQPDTDPQREGKYYPAL